MAVSHVSIGPRGSSTTLGSRGSVVSFSARGSNPSTGGDDIIGGAREELGGAVDRVRDFIRSQLTAIKQVAIAEGARTPLPIKVTALWIAGYGALKLVAKRAGIEDTFNAYVGDPFGDQMEVPNLSEQQWRDIIAQEAALLNMAGTVTIVPVWRRDPGV